MFKAFQVSTKYVILLVVLQFFALQLYICLFVFMLLYIIIFISFFYCLLYLGSRELKAKLIIKSGVTTNLHLGIIK